ncbi:hypothetical protein ChTU502y2012_386g0005 [Cryptosporidium hominis]|nr:hypothetical protein ChTU502y2012_386g0005 [Cryptosporidium hominis]
MNFLQVFSTLFFFLLLQFSKYALCEVNTITYSENKSEAWNSELGGNQITPSNIDKSHETNSKNASEGILTGISGINLPGMPLSTEYANNTNLDSSKVLLGNDSTTI